MPGATSEKETMAVKKNGTGWVCWLMPPMPVPGWLKQNGCCEWVSSLGYETISQKTTKQKPSDGKSRKDISN